MSIERPEKVGSGGMSQCRSVSVEGHFIDVESSMAVLDPPGNSIIDKMRNSSAQMAVFSALRRRF